MTWGTFINDVTIGLGRGVPAFVTHCKYFFCNLSWDWDLKDLFQVLLKIHIEIFIKNCGIYCGDVDVEGTTM